MKVAFITLGCKVNQYETRAMAELFAQAGWREVSFGEPADAYVVNTCTVTAVSDKKSRQQLARAHRLNPSAVIAAVGCYAQVAPEAVAALPGVSLVLGASGRAQIVSRVTEALARPAGSPAQNAVADIFMQRVFETLPAARETRTRATLKIQDGCVNACTYCIIPAARGPLRSRAPADTAAALAALAQSGCREVVLTGIHLASYGRDLPAGREGRRPDLFDALRAADASGIPRVRLGSLEPGFIDARFCREAASLSSLCRQFHLSLQSGSDAVLTRMNRRYDTARYAESVRQLRAAMPDCALTTDVITGFPGETASEHSESAAFIERTAFARIHVFPYSSRPGTAAARMPGQVPSSVKEARARELLALGERLECAYAAGRVGQTAEVLLEPDGTGYTRDYVRVRAPGAEGALVRCRITATEGALAVGVPVQTDQEEE